MKLKWILTFIAILFLMSCSDPSSSAGDQSLYRVVIRIESDNYVNINAYVYDENDNFVSNATMSVDGQSLVKQSGDNYNVYIDTIWADDSTHTFSISTPDGKSSSGSIVKPAGSLTGFSVSPSSNQGVNTYTVSPPSGSWPTGSYIECNFEEGGINYLIRRNPTGTADAVFTNSLLVTATSLFFDCAFQNEVSVDNYDPDSIVTLTGPFTSWD